MTRTCQVCTTPTTTFTTIGIPRCTITRTGRIFAQVEEQHRFLCPDHLAPVAS